MNYFNLRIIFKLHNDDDEVKQNYIERLANIFAPSIFQFKNQNFQTIDLNPVERKIMCKVLERFINFYSQNEYKKFGICEFSINLNRNIYGFEIDLIELMNPIAVNHQNIEELVAIYGDDNSEVCTYYGNILSPTDIIQRPISILFDAELGELYTCILIGINADVHDKNPDCIIYWLFYNTDYISNKREEKAEYVGPGLSNNIFSKFMVRSRYMFLMYKQTGKIENMLDSVEFNNIPINERPTVKIRDFEGYYNLELVAGNIFYCDNKTLPTVKHKFYDRANEAKPQVDNFSNLTGTKIQIMKPNYYTNQLIEKTVRKKRKQNPSCFSYQY